MKNNKTKVVDNKSKKVEDSKLLKKIIFITIILVLISFFFSVYFLNLLNLLLNFLFPLI
jgi:hypothetical protein